MEPTILFWNIQFFGFVFVFCFGTYSFVLECTIFTVLRFQRLLKSAGVQGLKTVFLITDAQIKEESFLEDIDSVLNTGEVPNIFAADEKQEIIEVSLETLFNFMSLVIYLVSSV